MTLASLLFNTLAVLAVMDQCWSPLLLKHEDVNYARYVYFATKMDAGLSEATCQGTRLTFLAYRPSHPIPPPSTSVSPPKLILRLLSLPRRSMYPRARLCTGQSTLTPLPQYRGVFTASRVPARSRTGLGRCSWKVCSPASCMTVSVELISLVETEVYGETC
jgi:hypothetical protein